MRMLSTVQIGLSIEVVNSAGQVCAGTLRKAVCTKGETGLTSVQYPCSGSTSGGVGAVRIRRLISQSIGNSFPVRLPDTHTSFDKPAMAQVFS